MLHDHMMYFGDRELIRQYLPVVERILHFFSSHCTQSGLVEKVGGVNGKAERWSFIDWAREWMPTEGMPTAVRLTRGGVCDAGVLLQAAPTQAVLGYTGGCRLENVPGEEKAGILLDYGRESHGTLWSLSETQ